MRRRCPGPGDRYRQLVIQGRGLAWPAVDRLRCVARGPREVESCQAGSDLRMPRGTASSRGCRLVPAIMSELPIRPVPSQLENARSSTVWVRTGVELTHPGGRPPPAVQEAQAISDPGIGGCHRSPRVELYGLESPVGTQSGQEAERVGQRTLRVVAWRPLGPSPGSNLSAGGPPDNLSNQSRAEIQD